ncbi:MAG: tetratricopeptide repeat protein [Myxococcales bacterium]|nr:tetratricopeptide repeat protein [Myxococcales bacterium]
MMRRPYASRLLLGFLSAALSFSAAVAQEQKRQVDIKAAPAAELQAPEKRNADATKKGPGFERDRQFGAKSKAEMSDAKFKDLVKTLNKLISATSNRDPAKPELYDRLSELFWQRSSDLTIRAFDTEGVCITAAAKNQAREKTCTADRERQTTSAQKYRDDAIKVYVEIVKNFPEYRFLDRVLFALAYNYQQKQEPDKAKKIYIELIKRYPKSQHVPDTLTNIGEIYFDAGEVEQALKAYQKVTTNYKDAETYPFATYKLGWCFYNIGNYKEALAQFLLVVRYTNEQAGRPGSNRLQLKKESLRDMVRAYANIEEASPNQALGFFRKAAPDDFLQLTENLAELYSLTGQFDKSNRLFRDLIAQSPKSYKVVGYQRQIAFNTRNMSRDPTEIVKEVKRLVDLWRTVKDAKDADPKRVAADREGFEELLRSLSVTMHVQWTKTKNADDYAIAYELYKDYLDTFPQGPNVYTVQFYYAELLYAGQKWREAALAYERTLSLNPTGESTQDAAQGQVLAYKKLIDIKQNKGANVADLTSTESSKSTEGVPGSKALPETHVKFIKACDLYSKYVKQSDFLVDIEYDAARVYYDFNQFDEALPRFKNISEKHAEHRLAIFAANLLLDTYNLTGNMDALEKQVDIFLKIYTPQRDPEFYELLATLKQQSSFKKCQGVERGKEWVKAAQCFKQYAANYPKSDFLDKAFFNAALNYEREKMLEQSIEMKLKIVNEVPQSELVPKSLYQIAGNLHALAIYSQAAKIYEAYAEKFPKAENARDALRNAAVFRQGLGEYDQAMTDSLAYMRLIGSKPEETAEVFFSIGLIFEKQEKWDDAIRHFNDYQRKFAKSGKPDLLLQSYVQIGNDYQKKKDGGNALKTFGAGYTAYTKLTVAEKAAVTTGLNSVAEARFEMGEAAYRKFTALKLKIQPYQNVKKYIEEMAKVIGKRTELVTDARTIYLEVIEFKSALWAIAALCRIGQMYQELANDIYDLAGPGSFTEDQVEAFKGAMAEKASAPEGKAVEAYVTCVKKAQELRWFSEWSDTCGKQLARLNPKEFRYDSEKRPAPFQLPVSVFQQPFIRKLPTQEEL